MFDTSSSVRIKYLLKKKVSLRLSFPSSLWVYILLEVYSFECLACSFYLLAATLGIFPPYQLYYHRCVESVKLLSHVELFAIP